MVASTACRFPAVGFIHSRYAVSSNSRKMHPSCVTKSGQKKPAYATASSKVPKVWTQSRREPGQSDRRGFVCPGVIELLAADCLTDRASAAGDFLNVHYPTFLKT